MSRRKKIFIGIVVFIITLLVVAIIYIDNIIEGTINRELSYQIELHKNEYQIKVGNVKSTFILKRLVIKDVSIKEIKNVKENPIEKFEFSLDKLVLKLHDFSEMFSDGEFWVKEIMINEPDLILNLALNEFGKKRKKKNKTGSTLFKKIRIDNINIIDGSLNLNQIDSIGTEINIAVVDKFDLNVKSTVLDLDSSKTGKKFDYEEFEFDISGIDINKIPDHFLKIEQVNYNSSNEIFIVKNIQFESSKSLESFKKTAQNNAPWMNLNVFDVKFKIPVNQILDKNIQLDLLEIGHSTFDFYQDNTLPEVSKKKTKFSYAKMLNKINFPFTIDTIRLLSSEANLRIIDKKINKEDTFNIRKINGDILFVSTDTVYQKVHPKVEMKVQSLLWENTPANISVILDVDSTSDRFEGHLRMGNLSYIKIKHLLEERININLHSGYVDHLKFNFLFFQNNMKGDLDLIIHDVNVNPKLLIFSDKVKDVRFSLEGLRLKAQFDRDLGMMGKLIVDTLVLNKPNISWINVEAVKKLRPKKVEVKSGEVLFKTFQINYYYLDRLSLKIFNKSRDSLPIVSVDDGWIKSKSIRVDENSDGTMSFNPGHLSLRLKNVSFNNSTSNFFDINQIDYGKQKGQLSARGIRYKSNGSKFDFLSRKTKDKFWMGFYVEKGAVDFDILKVIKGEYKITRVKIDNPIITFVNDPNDTEAAKSKEKKAKQSKNKISYLIDKVVLDNADIKYSIRTKQNKEHKVLLANKINLRISNITNDSLQLIKNHELKLDLVGRAFGQSHINIAANLDQRPGKDKANLSFDLVDLSLKEVNERLSPFIHNKLKDGKLIELHLVLKRNNKRITGNVSLKDLEIKDLELGGKKEKPDLLSVKIPGLKVDFKRNENDIKPILNLGSVELIKPVITLRNHTSKDKDKTKEEKKPAKNKPVFASHANNPNMIIDDFKIKYAMFSLFTDQDTKPHSAIRNWSLNVNGIRFYENKGESLLPLSVNNLVLDAKEIGTINNPDIFINVSKIKYNLKEEKLTINNLKVKNTKTLVELYRGEMYRKPWFDVYVPKVQLSFDLDELVNTNPHIRRVDIDGTKFLFEFDFKLAINPKIKPLFVDMIRSSSIPYTIDTVSITNSDATIYMQENTRERSGYLIFNDINGTIDNISNDPKVIAEKPNTLIDIGTVLWGKGKSHVIGEISLSDPDKYFNLKGVVDTMDLTVADTLIKNVFNMSIKSGRLNQAKFDIDFNETQANGSVLFNYEKLKVTMFKGQHAVKVNTDSMSMAAVDKKEKLNSSFMMKIIVNGLIKENNLPGKGNYAIGSAAYVREPDKPVFRYVWYSLAGGMLEATEGGLIRVLRNIGGGKEDNAKKEKKAEKKTGN